MNSLIRDLAARVASKLSGSRFKELNELAYWKKRKKVEKTLANDHYHYFYTGHFGLEDAFYEGKVLLDIGCGPRGSLEWATMASRAIGLDPLASKYLRLGADEHRMDYIDAPSESIPLADGECDAVFSFNSLDHVEDVHRSLSEIKRIVRPGGIFLLLVEINHPPTACEPHQLNPRQLIEALAPEFTCENPEVYRPTVRSIYKSIRAGQKIEPPLDTDEIGYFSAKFIRREDPVSG